MRARALEVRGFRNLAQTATSLPDGIALVHGPNGAGKSNLLEAAFFALTGRSCRTRDDRRMIGFDADLARAEIETETEGRRFNLLASVSSLEGRRHLIDGSPATPATARQARPPVCVFLPDRLGLVKGGPSGRRAHLDRFVAARWPGRADLRSRFGAALRQRNSLLARVRAGQAAVDGLDAWDAEFAAESLALIAAREDGVGVLREHFAAAAEALGLPPPASIRYRPKADADGPEPFVAELLARREQDLHRGHSGYGPQLDEVELRLGERSLRRYGSQGEQRTALLALLFAERTALIDAGAPPPLMLLDDVFSELDPERRRLLVERLGETGQAVITATEPGQVPGDAELTSIAVRSGSVVSVAEAA